MNQKEFKERVDILILKLQDAGFIVCQANSKKSESVYLKLDYGVGGSIRISNHDNPSKRFLFNVRGDMDTYHRECGEFTKRTCEDMEFFPLMNDSQLDALILKLQCRKQNKINRVGVESYYFFMGLGYKAIIEQGYSQLSFYKLPTAVKKSKKKTKKEKKMKGKKSKIVRTKTSKERKKFNGGVKYIC